jgi:hypothetical protein
MALSDWRQFENDEDISLAFGHVIFISTKPNSHRHMYSEEVIEEYAPSYLGKFIVSDIKNGDATSHTETQLIIGYIPSNQEVQYTYDEEGYFQAGVDVVISKIYAIDAYNMFKNKDNKSVSVEQLVGFTAETENGIDGIDDKIVIGFEGIGVTVLGDNFMPSVPTANIKMIKMSAEEFESEYIKYSDTKHIKNEDNIMSEILNKLNKIEEKLSKEEIMTKDNKVEIVKYAVSIGDDLWGKIYQALKEKYPKADGDWITSKYRIVGIYEEGAEKFVIVEDYDDVKKFKIMFTLTETELELADDKTEVTVDFVETNQMEMFTKEEFSTYEEALKPEEMVKEQNVDEPETKEDEMACGEKEKLAEVENKLSEAEAKIANYEVELSELKEFKIQIEAVKCQEIIENTLSIAKKVVDETKYNELETESKECVYASVNDWSTKVKASLSEIAIAKMEEVKLSAKEDDVVDMGMPIHVEKTKESIYD